jgi:hypothetical protein
MASREAAVTRTDVGSSPSDLVAEHAARLCDAKPNATPRSTLFDWIKKGANGQPEEAGGVH